MNRLIVPAATIAGQLRPDQRAQRRRAYRRSDAGELSDQQVKILSMVAAGMTRDNIAGQLYLVKGAVNTQLLRARLKLHAQNTAEAVDIARERGLLGGEGNGQARAA